MCGGGGGVMGRGEGCEEESAEPDEDVQTEMEVCK